MPQTTRYRLRKGLRRHWPWALAGSAALLVAAGFTVGLAQQRDRAVEAEALALDAAQHALRSEAAARQAEDEARDTAGQARHAEGLALRAERQARDEQARAQQAEHEALRQRDRARAAELQTAAARDSALSEGRRAQMEADTTRETSRFLMSVFTGADPKLTGLPDLPRSILLDKGRERLAQEMGSNAGVRARLQVVLGDVYERIGRLDDAIAAYLDAATLFASPPIAQPLAEADALRRLSVAYNNNGQQDLAEPAARRNLALLEQHDTKNRVGIAEAENRLGINLINLRRYDAAGQRLEHAVQLFSQQLGPDNHNTLSTMHNLARLNRLRGQAELAEAQMRRTLVLKRRSDAGALDARTLGSLEEYALILSDLQRHDDAVRAMREAVQGWTTVFGADNSNVGIGRHRLGRVLREAGRLDEAGIELLQALRIEAQNSPAATVRKAQIAQDQAAGFEAAGRLLDAEQAWRRALADFQQVKGVHPLVSAVSRQGLANTLWLMGRFDEAQQQLAPVLGLRNQLLPAGNDEWAQSRLLAAELALARGDSAAAALQIDEIAAALPASLRGQQLDLLALRGHAATVAGRPAEAARWLAAAWQGQLAWRGLAHPAQLPLGLALQAALRADGQPGAVSALRPALEACASAHAPESPWQLRLAQH